MIDRLLDEAADFASKLATVDRTLQSVYMRCEGIDIDLDAFRMFDELRVDYIEKLRRLGESLASRTIELENFIQSQLPAYREQFISIDRRSGQIEARLGAVEAAPRLVVLPNPILQSLPRYQPNVGQPCVQQAAAVPVPVSDGQSFSSYPAAVARTGHSSVSDQSSRESLIC